MSSQARCHLIELRCSCEAAKLLNKRLELVLCHIQDYIFQQEHVESVASLKSFVRLKCVDYLFTRCIWVDLLLDGFEASVGRLRVSCSLVGEKDGRVVLNEHSEHVFYHSVLLSVFLRQFFE